MNINPNKRLNSSVVGTNVTLSGTLAVNNVTVTGNIDATTTAKTVTVTSLVTKDYITLPTSSTVPPTLGKLGYLISQTGSYTQASYTSGNYITPTGTGTALTAGLWIIFGNTIFSFTSPTSLTKIGTQLSANYHGNSATLLSTKTNSLSAIEYSTAITSNIPSKITLNTPPYYHHVTNATTTTPIYIVNNTTYAGTGLTVNSYLQAIRIA